MVFTRNGFITVSLSHVERCFSLRLIRLNGLGYSPLKKMAQHLSIQRPLLMRLDKHNTHVSMARTCCPCWFFMVVVLLCLAQPSFACDLYSLQQANMEPSMESMLKPKPSLAPEVEAFDLKPFLVNKPAYTHTEQTVDNLYIATLTILLEEIPVGHYHQWLLDLRSFRRKAVLDAKISVTAKLPEDKLQWVNRPVITALDKPGLYLIDNVQFREPGQWEIQVRVTSEMYGMDKVNFNVRVRKGRAPSW